MRPYFIMRIKNLNQFRKYIEPYSKEIEGVIVEKGYKLTKDMKYPMSIIANSISAAWEKYKASYGMYDKVMREQ